MKDLAKLSSKKRWHRKLGPVKFLVVFYNKDIKEQAHRRVTSRVYGFITEQFPLRLTQGKVQKQQTD